MPGLNLHTDEPRDSKKSKNKMLKIVLGIGVLIAVPVIGTTLAASISINSNAAVQFGQGITQAVACDTDGVTVTALSEFTNSAGAGSFKLGDVTIEGIADACDGKSFKVSVYDDSSSTPLTSCGDVVFSTSYGGGAGGGGCVSGDTSVQYVGSNNSLNDNSLQIQFGGSTPIDAQNVYKVTVETS